jgi:hypothetical protein
MDRSMRMVLIAGMLMLALLVAVVGMVSAEGAIWQSAITHIPTVASQPL